MLTNTYLENDRWPASGKLRLQVTAITIIVMVENHGLWAVEKLRRTIVGADIDDSEEKGKYQRVHGQDHNRAQGQQNHPHADHEQYPQPTQDEADRKAAEEERGNKLEHLCCCVKVSVGVLVVVFVCSLNATDNNAIKV